MFDDLSNLDRYAIFPDEAYLSEASFETTVGFLKYMANDLEEDLSLQDEILVFQLKEGVFVRSRNTHWSEALTKLAKEPVENFPTLKLFPLKKLEDLTRDYRRPIDLFGDDRLVRWKIGF